MGGNFNMAIDMKYLACVAICIQTVLQTALGDSCVFPVAWQYPPRRWVTGISTDLQQSNLLHIYRTYTRTYSYHSTEPFPEKQIVKYNCHDMKISGSSYYHLRNTPTTSSLVCVREMIINDKVLLHNYEQPVTQLQRAEDCISLFQNVPRYSIFLKYDTTSGFGGLEEKCPFADGLYSVFYRDAYTAEENCKDNPNAVTRVQGSRITLLTCANSAVYDRPYTGTFHCLTTITQDVFGETVQDANGNALILGYLDAEGHVAGYYCARYRESAGHLQLSMDTTSREGPSCRRGARYDWAGPKADERYVYFSLTYKDSFTTLKPATPQPNQQTAPIHIQFAFDQMYTSFTDISAALAALQTDIPQVLHIAPDRLEHLRLDEGLSGRALVTFDLKPGNSVEGMFQHTLWGVAPVSFHGNSLTPSVNSYSAWFDTISCPSEPCGPHQRCWILETNFTCECLPGHSGAGCGVTGASGSGTGGTVDNTTLIIIVVCCVIAAILIIVALVFVGLRHCRKNKFTDEMVEIDQDREMYSTISMKPTAYHGKKFSGATIGDQSGLGYLKNNQARDSNAMGTIKGGGFNQAFETYDMPPKEVDSVSDRL